ncbi:hypothetical protein CTEN210_12140 [Chaetoceros tenuissimus]|uniref:Uncharacterized protein n=1 Tax=Chaetoceros tenuissimus TaxID=426638 RepID=A0AAD3D404_9STRA|nr:hypothetical protein CTEN210_12140 [Chaetoceros tenuissimus]
MDNHTIFKVEVDIKNKDAKYSYYNRLANEAAKNLQTALETKLQKQNVKADLKRVVRIKIKTCDPGSRGGRICCGELGVGWAKFAISWEVSEGDSNDAVVLGKKAYETSGAIGFEDMCSPDVGENFIFQTASVDAPSDIWRTIFK